MNKEYVEMLVDSLKKKENMLKEVLKLSEEQGETVKTENVDWDRFDKIVSDKEELIEQIEKLDEGFDTLFARIKDDLDANKTSFTGEIATMKVSIKTISEISANIEATEIRNKSMIENGFNNTKKTIKQGKLGNKAAAQYYQKMSKINTIDPQMMDKKS